MTIMNTPGMEGDSEAGRGDSTNPLAGVRDGYDRWAAAYDHDANPLPPLEEPLIDALLGAVAGRRALDLGCGTGRHAARLSRAGAIVTALDFSEGMLSVARSRPELATATILRHDLHQPVPLPAEAFDRVVSGLVLEHLADPLPFFRELARLLAPHGIAAVSTLHPAMFALGSRAKYFDPNTGEARFPGSVDHSEASVTDAIHAAGLVVRARIEAIPEEAFAARFPRARRYLGQPMVLAWGLQRGDHATNQP
jgi:malonyl-CoA O-methyltransferase